jgi:hypothetical protein
VLYQPHEDYAGALGRVMEAAQAQTTRALVRRVAHAVQDVSQALAAGGKLEA